MGDSLLFETAVDDLHLQGSVRTAYKTDAVHAKRYSGSTEMKLPL